MDPMIGVLAQRDPFSWGDDGLRIGVIVAVAVVVSLVSRLVVRRFRRRLEGSPSVTQVVNLQRATTLTQALSTALVVVIWVTAVLLVLGELHVNLAPLLASAGVAGVALGFGAQSLVKDTLSGFFILLENQFGVGDVVELHTTGGAVAGKVEALTLRVTTIRAFDGSLHIVPNGNLQVVSNRSRGWGRAIVDVRVAHTEDPEAVREILEELFEELHADAAFSEPVREGPSVLGVETTSDFAQVVRVIADTRPSKRLDVERLLRERITKRLAERGVRLPTPPIVARPDAGA
jgi:small conductance mechanosensitive channel